MASKPEQHAASVLTPLGFIFVHGTRMPYGFIDKEGEQFSAMADFYHPALDLYVEIKYDHLNGKTSQRCARNGYNAIEPAKLIRYAAYYQTRQQWNHAAPKQAIVQTTVGRAQFAVLFIQPPNDATLARISKQGIEAYGLSRFASMIELQLACQNGARSALQQSY